MTCDPNTTTKSREEIERLLADFEKRLPALLEGVEEWQLAETFAGEADHILCSARDEDYDDVGSYLQDLADKVGIGHPPTA